MTTVIHAQSETHPIQFSSSDIENLDARWLTRDTEQRVTGSKVLGPSATVKARISLNQVSNVLSTTPTKSSLHLHL